MISRPGSSGGFARAWAVLSAAMALLGAGGPAQAGLITRNVNVTLNAGNVESFDLDVDLDGTTDFTFTAALIIDPVISVGFDVVDFPFGGNNGVVIDQPTINGFPTASILRPGDAVSPTDTFSSASFDQGNLFFFTSFDPPSGNFEGRTGFLGLRFDTPGGVVFGFAQITVNALDAPVNPLGLTIGLIGFNDVPGQGVTIVPEPTSLTLLGSGGLVLLAASRRRTRTRAEIPG